MSKRRYLSLVDRKFEQQLKQSIFPKLLAIFFSRGFSLYMITQFSRESRRETAGFIVEPRRVLAVP